MAVDYDKNNQTSGLNSDTRLNTELTKIQTAFQDCVSRSGGAPNAMSSDFDLGGNDILNAGVVNCSSFLIDGQPLASLADLTAQAAAAATSATAAATSATASATSATASATSATAAASSATDAETAQAAAEAAQASLTLPTIAPGDAGKLLEVNPGETGYQFTATIDTAQITDNAVTLAKLEDGTQGDVLYYGASGAPTRLAAGTSGQVLSTQGAGANPQWIDQSTGEAPVLLATATVTAGDTSEDLLDVFSTNSGYKYYRVAIRRLEQDTAAGFTGIRISENGTTAKSGSTDYAYQLEQNSYTTVMAYARDPGASAVYLNATNATSGTVTDAVIDFFDPADTTNIKPINFDSVMTDSVAASRKSSGMGAYTPNNNAIAGFQVFTTAGDFAGGTIEVWGSNFPMR